MAEFPHNILILALISLWQEADGINCNLTSLSARLGIGAQKISSFRLHHYQAISSSKFLLSRLMKRWEFLIQHEDHQTWQPILTPTWEVETGKYHLVAHCDCPQRNIEIQITHETWENGVSHRHCEKYYRSTNSEGLIVILPLTELEPGTWEIHCYGDLMEELLGNRWQKSLQLQVLPQQTIEEIEEEEQPLTLDYTDIFTYTGDSEEDEAENTALFPESPPVSHKNDLPELKLNLEQDTIIRAAGEPVTISGKVETISLSTGEASEEAFIGKLRLELKSDSSPDLLFVQEYNLAEAPLPLSFAQTIDIPADWEVSLLEGELVLEEINGDRLARHSLVIATDLNDTAAEPHINYTIELASVEGDSSFSFDLLVPEEVATTSLPLKLIEPEKMAKTHRLASPASGSALPPKLKRFRSHSPQRQRPELPKVKVQQTRFVSSGKKQEEESQINRES